MKKVIMTVQPDLLQSASKRRQTSASVDPRVLTKKRKMITRRVVKKLAPASPSPSESNTNQDAAEDIPNAESPDQHEMAATPDALSDASEEQTDALDVNTSSDRTIAPEPPNTSSSEQSFDILGLLSFDPASMGLTTPGEETSFLQVMFIPFDF
ncbi:uncharacterized protein LOC120639938 [Panicum virgatum]|uniref:uncharacterized protein LOC120639938 n=1 Tax=Panicum virgatum TaxID=38727 RepID=UPI0019D581D9|nr:uncharacterized protein LOC120639938 [Panicum virgatum]